MAHYKLWTAEEVETWLGSISMEHLIHKFVMLNVNGEKLDDPNLVNELKLPPGEKVVLMGAIKTLKDQHTLETRTRSMSGDGKPKTASKKLQTQSSKKPEPQVVIGPAPQLLNEECTHSGWIRKTGGRGRGWRQRYLVLSRGHCYYYENERSRAPKGYFSLYNYKVERATKEDVKLSSHPWTLILVNSNPNMRKYLIQTAAKHEMEKWLSAFEEGIKSYETSPSEEEDDEGHYEHLYDAVAYDDDDDERPVYDTVAPDDEVDDPDHDYTKITDFTSPPEMPVPSHSPVHTVSKPMPPPRPPSQSHTLPAHTHPPSNALSHRASMPNRISVGNAPIVLPRSKESLSISIETESPYLQITGEARHSSYSSPHPPPKHDTSSVPSQGSSLPQRMISNHDNEDISNEIEEENPYYIDLKKTTELAPDHCIFDNISRDEAESRLIKLGRRGTYLLRDGTHKDAKYVLSVWTGTKAKHYKLYYKELDDEYCLTEGQSFRKINDLLANYKDEDLPRSPGIKLGEPYHPLDR